MRTRGPIDIVRRRWVSILAVTAVGLLGGLGSALVATETYRASASVYFSLTNGNSAADLVQGSTYAQNQVQSFAQLAATPAVLQPVVDELDLDVPPAALAAQVEAVVPVDTVIVQVTVTDPSPERSARLADAVVRALSAVVEDIAPADAEGAPAVRATTVAPAEVPVEPSSPDVPLSLAAGLLAGLAAGAALAWGQEALDTRVRDADALAEVTGLPVVGALGAWDDPAPRRVVVATDPHGTSAESFRQLRTNLQFLRIATDEGAVGAHVVSVTSSLPGEGKSTISANLAATLAETGARVLLVDADLRRPALADVLGLEGAAGLTTVLAGDAGLDDVVQTWGEAGLHVLTSGAIPPNPAEILGSPAMRSLVGELRLAYDYVVVDTAPLLPVADATVLTRVVDGTLVVANARTVRRAQLADALATLEQVGARVLGVVLNQVRRDEEPYTYRADRSAGDVHEAVAPLPETVEPGRR